MEGRKEGRDGGKEGRKEGRDGGKDVWVLFGMY
jgi:hypothetical protein